MLLRESLGGRTRRDTEHNDAYPPRRSGGVGWVGIGVVLTVAIVMARSTRLSSEMRGDDDNDDPLFQRF